MSDKILTNVFTMFRKKLLHTAMHILPSEDDAADALQEAFCKLWPRRDAIDDEAKAETLSKITVRNICIDKIRKRKIATIPLDEEHDSSDEESCCEREELFKRVKKIIDKELTVQQRIILELKDYEGLSTEEIAQRLSMSESAVRMNLSRARKRVREEYRKEATNEE